jgi:hypothetical protein
MTTVNVYVTAPAGASIAGYGHRNYGEAFELPPEVADEVCARPGFSKEDPTKPTPKPTNWRSKKDAGVEEEISSDSSQ